MNSCLAYKHRHPKKNQCDGRSRLKENQVMRMNFETSIWQTCNHQLRKVGYADHFLWFTDIWGVSNI